MLFDISKKSKYAITALVALALTESDRPLTARAIAGQQQVPVRFLEIILNELKQGGFVRSLRGKAGGYVLARPAREITTNNVFNFLESPFSEPVPATQSPILGQLALESLMEQANQAITDVFDNTTIEDIAQQEIRRRDAFEINYVI